MLFVIVKTHGSIAFAVGLNGFDENTSRGLLFGKLVAALPNAVVYEKTFAFCSFWIYFSLFGA